MVCAPLSRQILNFGFSRHIGCVKLMIEWVWYIVKGLALPAGIVGISTAYAFRQGPELFVAARRAGMKLGMGYNYFKVFVKLMTPEAE